MNAPQAPALRGDQEHPSPHRGRTSLWSQWIALTLAPLAWFVQLCVDTPLLSQACYPRDEPLRGALPQLMPYVLAADGVTLLVCLVGAFVGWRAWRRTAGEGPGRGHRLLASGVGRSRFMAMTGMLLSGLIGIAVVVIAMLHALMPQCGL